MWVTLVGALLSGFVEKITFDVVAHQLSCQSLLFGSWLSSKLPVNVGFYLLNHRFFFLSFSLSLSVQTSTLESEYHMTMHFLFFYAHLKQKYLFACSSFVALISVNCPLFTNATCGVNV